MTKAFTARYDYDQEHQDITVHVILGDEGPAGLTLRRGINTILTIEQAQIPLLELDLKANALTLQTELGESAKKVTFSG